MTPRETRLINHQAIDFDGDPTREEYLRLQAVGHSLACILPDCGGGALPSLRGIVDRVLHCDCGFEARAKDEDGLVAEVQRHARETHGMALSRDEALLLAVRAELNEEARSTIPHQPRTRMDEEEK